MVGHINRQCLRQELLGHLGLTLEYYNSLFLAVGNLVRQLVSEENLVALRALGDGDAVSVFPHHKGRPFSQAETNDAFKLIIVEY